MSHTYLFSPPVRGNWRGPQLRLPLEDPLLEERLASGKVEGPEHPYRRSAVVENLLDDLTFRTRPDSVQQSLHLISLGLLPGKKGMLGTSFELAPGHIHATNERMSPDVLLEHSEKEEGGKVVRVTIEDEISVLAVAMMRRLGYSTYLSAVESPAGTQISGLVVLRDNAVHSMVMSERHPYVSKLVIFEDDDTVNVLRLLSANNGLKKLFDKIRVCGKLGSGDEERFRLLMGEFASGAIPAHHLMRTVEEIFVAFASTYPDLIGSKNNLS